MGVSQSGERDYSESVKKGININMNIIIWQKRLVFLALIVVSASVQAYTLKYCIRTEGDPVVKVGHFYGYKSSSEGPGDNSFKASRELAEQEGVPLLVIYGAAVCGTCDKFAQAVDLNFKPMAIMLGHMECMKCYFRGDTPACRDARAFFDELARIDNARAPVRGTCHMMGYYAVFPDGEKFARTASLPSGVVEFQTTEENWYREYTDLYSKHLKKLPKGSAGFACGGTEKSGCATCGLEGEDFTRLEMVSNVTQSVFVPFTRTNNLTNVETNWLAVTYPGETVASTNIQFVWSANGPTATNLEVEVDVSMVTNVGERIVRLEYLNTNQVSLATNWISCVGAVTNGTLMSPWLPGAKQPLDLNWGDWTLDFAAATNRAAQEEGSTFAILGSPVWAKTAYDIFGTNDAAFVKYCTDNKLSLAVVDVADAAGSSLFSHKVAATGRSGTSFLSRNGLCTTNEDVVAMKAALAEVDAAYRKAPAGAAEFVLIRADGTVAGRFAPYTGAGAATENSYRMAELLQLLDDPNEELNNDPTTTPVAMTVAYGNESPSNTLHASDRQDVFLVSGVPAGQPVSIALGKDRSLEGADVTMTVIAFTNAADRSQYREVKPALSGVWVFSAAEASSLGVIVSAWKNGTEKLSYNGDSAIRYVVKAEAAPPNAGKIFLAKESDNVLINDGLDYTFAVERTGYTGSAQVTIDVDEDLTTATNACYEWEGPVTVTWDENTWSVSNLTVKLIPTGDFSGDGDIVFRAKDCTGADFVGTNLFWLSVSQKPTENVGTLSIVDPEPTDETLYLSEGSNVTIRLNRDGNHNGTQRGRLVVTGGKLSTNTVEWTDYDMTDKTVVWTLPTLGTTTKKQDVRLLLSGLEGSPVDAAKSALSVCVLPADAPKFTTDLLEISAVQYADVGENQLGLTALPAGWTVKGIRSISGSLPSGFAINCAADGSVTVSGTTAGTLSGESAWWLELNRADGSATYSYPVTIRTVVTALAEANPWFKTSRTWTGLPIILASGDDAPISLRGALDLTIAKDGRTSAKYRTLGNRTASFAADRLAIQPNGTAIIEATTEIGGAAWGLEVKLWPGNAADEHKTMDMQVMISDPALAGQTVYSGYIGGGGAVNWSAERENEIRPWSGVYALAFTGEGGWGANTLCTGNPSVQVRFASESQWRMGRATYAGVLPNGKTISGSATFAPAAEGFAALDLPMLTTSAADDFAAVVSVTNRGADVMAVERAAVPSLWNHTERGFPQLSYSNAYAVVGSRFTATNDWAAVWGAEQLEFSIDGVRSGANLAPNGWRVKSDDEALSASVNRNSGAMMGVFRVYDGVEKLWRPYQWKGSALPGAVNFMLGAYWYNFPTNVRNAADCEVRKTVRVGGSVEAVAVEE